MIRKAELQDVFVIMEMAKKFYVNTTYHIDSKIPLNEEDVACLIENLISSGIIHVAEINNEIVGVVGIILVPFLFNSDYTHAGEIVLWVDPHARVTGVGKMLISSLEIPAKNAQVTHIQMLDLVSSGDHVGRLYESCGYKLTERAYTKVI